MLAGGRSQNVRYLHQRRGGGLGTCEAHRGGGAPHL